VDRERADVEDAVGRARDRRQRHGP
jgi:hypothetical protein